MTKKPEIETLWTIKELARFLGKPPNRAFYGWIRANGVPRLKLGASVRFVPGDVLAWAKAQRG